MTLASLLTFAAMTSLLIMSPGPNGVLIAKTVPTSGKAAGFANVAGFVAAFYMHGAFSVFGISLLLLQSATLFMIVKYLGAAYLCWIGFKALLEAFSASKPALKISPAKRHRTLMRAFGEGFLTNALNPKVAMFYLAVFPQFIAHDASAMSTAFTLVTIHASLNILWFGAMIMVFSGLAKFARGGKTQRWIKGMTGVVFIGFAAKLATFRP